MALVALYGALAGCCAAHVPSIPDAAPDAGNDAASSGPTLTISYSDPCPCWPPPCCPTTTFDFRPAADRAAWYLFCGDALACDPPPIGWERANGLGGWDRIVSPNVSPASGFLCAPGSYTNPWINSVPEPPGGTVRAVALFDDECGASAQTCGARCNRPYEVVSNAITVPARCAAATGSSSLPGVSLDLTGNRCSYTLAEVAAGVEFVYRVVVDGDLAGVQMLSTGCNVPGSSGLIVQENIGGGGQNYCVCDRGKCGATSYESNLVAGTYEARFAWEGVNWYGPSDTGNPYGPPFPPGTYQFTVTATGTYAAPGGATAFALQGAWTFDLVPPDR